MSVAARVAGAFARRLPRWPHARVVRRGHALGRIAYRLDRRHRHVAQANLAVAFPERSLEWRNDTARRSFEQAGRTLLETLWSPSLPDDATEFFTYEGFEHVEAALARGKGVLIASAHFGNWELMTLALVAAGVPLTSVARPLDDPDLDRLIRGLRTRTGQQLLERRNSVREILRTLRRNEAVTVMADQNTIRREAVFVPYFGRQASANPSLGTLHERTQAAVVPVFAFPTETGYRLRAEPAVEAHDPQAPRDQRVLAIITQVTERIERAVREAPEAWLWMHDRWRVQP